MLNFDYEIVPDFTAVIIYLDNDWRHEGLDAEIAEEAKQIKGVELAFTTDYEAAIKNMDALMETNKASELEPMRRYGVVVTCPPDKTEYVASMCGLLMEAFTIDMLQTNRNNGYGVAAQIDSESYEQWAKAQGRSHPKLESELIYVNRLDSSTLPVLAWFYVDGDAGQKFVAPFEFIEFINQIH